MLLLGLERCQVTPTGQRGHWRGGQRELWAGKEGGKCVVSLFSFTSLSLWREESRKKR